MSDEALEALTSESYGHDHGHRNVPGVYDVNDLGKTSNQIDVKI